MGCEYEKPVFDTENNTPMPSNSPEIPVQSDVSTEKMRITPGTEHECSLEFFPQTEHLCDVTDTHPDMELDMETNSEQPNNSPTNPGRSKYNLRHNPKPNCIDDHR